MKITKKWTILLIFSIAIALVIFFLFYEKKSTLHPSSKLENVAEQELFQHKEEVLENEIAYSVSSSSAIQEALTKEDFSKKSIAPPALSKTTKVLDIHQQRQNDPTVTLKISNFSPQEQAVQKKWVTNYNENGYIQTDEVSFDYIKAQNELVEQVTLDPSTISIPLQEASTTKLSKYEYTGILLDTEKTETEQNSIRSEITRAYKGHDGQEIFLLEKSVKNSKAILVDEFVTDHINGYPASRMTFCTESHRCMSKITLITKDKFYELSTYGDQDSTKDELIEIISSFDLPELDIQ